MPTGVYVRTEEHKKRLGISNKKAYREGRRKKIRYWLGKKHPLAYLNLGKYAQPKNNSYTAIHKWLTRWFGQPRFCEGCGTQTANKYEWANISGEYKRRRNDYLRLCRKCHCKFDGINEKISEAMKNKKQHLSNL